MPTKLLPQRPSLAHLKRQANDLCKAHRAHDTAAAQRIREFHPKCGGLSDDAIFGRAFAQSDALLTIAREYGFPSWPRLKTHIESEPAIDTSLRHDELILDPDFRSAVAMLDAGDEAGLRELIALKPSLLKQRVVFEGGNYFRNPSLLEFIAENPVRYGRMPENVVSIARMLLEAGAGDVDETLGLVASGSVARESGKQCEMIAQLCSFGADPDVGMRAALVHGEMDAVQCLLAQGATRSLAVAAALGEVAQMASLVERATPEERHLALSLAAQFGKASTVTLLIESGESPDRFSPVGGHSHATPLHHAVWGGHLETVKTLVEHGAKLDIRDILFDGTPLDWAEYGGRDRVAEYLRSVGAPGPGSG